MTERAYTTESLTSQDGQQNAIRVTWAGLRNADTGAPYAAPSWTVRDVQTYGTFGASGKVAMQGSNAGAPAPNFVAPADAQWGALHEADGDAGLAEMTTAAFCRLLETPLLMRPKVTVGDTDTDLTVVMLVRP